MKKLVKTLKLLRLLWFVNFMLKLFEKPYRELKFMIQIFYKIVSIIIVLIILLFLMMPFFEEMNQKKVYLKFLNKVSENPKIYINNKEILNSIELLNGLSQIEIAGFSDEGRNLKDKCHEIKILSDSLNMKICLISDLHIARYWVFFEEYSLTDGKWEPLYLKAGVLDERYVHIEEEKF